MTTALLPQPMTGRVLRFWQMQLLVWLGYALVLMLPWVGEYPLRIMVPNKLVIAFTGMLVSAALREGYRRLRPGTNSNTVVIVAIAASLVGGLLWNATTSALLGGSALDDMRRIAALDAGMPRFGGALYQALVLFAWSVAYLTVAQRRRRPAHAISAMGDRIVARDATRALVTPAEEIDWVEAAGDYVRVHMQGRTTLLRGTMAEYEKTLNHGRYVRIHRSTIVNVGRVRELLARPNRELLVVLRDGTRLRASRTYADRIRHLLGV